MAGGNHDAELGWRRDGTANNLAVWGARARAQHFPGPQSDGFYSIGARIESDLWSWTLGQAQYDWLKRTLEGSSRRYKFVFAHHVVGQTRGGVTNTLPSTQLRLWRCGDERVVRHLRFRSSRSH